MPPLSTLPTNMSMHFLDNLARGVILHVTVNNSTKNKPMKVLMILAVMALTLTARAEWVNGYVTRNGRYVHGYYRSTANSTVYDNLSYRGYPSQQPGYVPLRTYNVVPSFNSYAPRPLPAYPSVAPQPLPAFPSKDYAPKPLYNSKDYAPRTAYPTK